MMEKEELKEMLMEAIDIVSIINELLKKATMVDVDYSGVYDDLKWNKIMLRNRLDSLNEAQNHWITAKEYLKKLDEE